MTVATDISRTNAFFTPPNTGGGNSVYTYNEVYALGTFMNITWAVNVSSYQIQLWQQSLSGWSANRGPLLYEVTNQTQPNTSAQIQHFNWPVAVYELNHTWSNVFFIDCFVNGSTYFVSHYFNITDQPLTSSTTLAASSTGTTLAASSTSTTTTASSTSTTTTASSTTSVATASPTTALLAIALPSPTTAATLPSTTKIAIGVGAGVGLCLLIIACILISYRFSRQRRLRKMRKLLESDVPPSYAASTASRAQKSEKSAAYTFLRFTRALRMSMINELPGRRSPVELAG